MNPPPHPVRPPPGAVPGEVLRTVRKPAYRAILPLRTDNAEGAVIIVDGVSANHRAIDALGD